MTRSGEPPAAILAEPGGLDSGDNAPVFAPAFGAMRGLGRGPREGFFSRYHDLNAPILEADAIEGSICEGRIDRHQATEIEILRNRCLLMHDGLHAVFSEFYWIDGKIDKIITATC